MCRRAVEGREKVVGREHPDTIDSIGILVLILQDRSKIEEAEELSLQELERSERTNGNDHLQTLNAVYRHAMIKRTQKEYEVSASYFARALEGSSRVYGPEHKFTQNCAEAHDDMILLLHETKEAPQEP